MLWTARIVVAIVTTVAVSNTLPAQTIRPLSVEQLVDRIGNVREEQGQSRNDAEFTEDEKKFCTMLFQLLPEEADPSDADLVPDKFLHAFSRCRQMVATSLDDTKTTELRDKAGFHRGLIDTHANYKHLKRWLRWHETRPGQANPPTQAVANPPARALAIARAELSDLGDKLHDVLKAHGLSSDFTAFLLTGAVVEDVAPTTGDSEDGDAGAAAAEPEAETPAPDPERKTKALGTVIWQSKHFSGNDFGRWDFSYGGKFGFQPVLYMAKPEPVSTDSEPAQDENVADTPPIGLNRVAFAFNIGIQANLKTNKQSELSTVLRVGGTQVGDEPEFVEGDEGEGFLATPVNKNDAPDVARSRYAASTFASVTPSSERNPNTNRQSAAGAGSAA